MPVMISVVTIDPSDPLGLSRGSSRLEHHLLGEHMGTLVSKQVYQGFDASIDRVTKENTWNRRDWEGFCAGRVLVVGADKALSMGDERGRHLLFYLSSAY